MTPPPAPCACHCVEMKVPSVTGSLPIVRGVVEKVVGACGVADEEAGAIGLAVDEALANVIKHGYGGEPGQPIEVCIRIVDEGARSLVVTIRDFGRQIDPAGIRGRRLEDVRPGGLGVHIMRTVMDQVDYSCPDGGGMAVRMVKRLGAGHPKD